MAINNTQRGFTLLIAVIFMSVMLAFGLALGSLSYKQQVLTSSAIESQYAFYAADAALECALYADQHNDNFNYDSHDLSAHPGPVVCEGVGGVEIDYTYTATQLMVKQQLSLDGGKHCADVTIYKPKPGLLGTAYIFSQGYDVSCATLVSPGSGARIVNRGINVQYSVN